MTQRGADDRGHQSREPRRTSCPALTRRPAPARDRPSSSPGGATPSRPAGVAGGGVRRRGSACGAGRGSAMALRRRCGGDVHGSRRSRRVGAYAAAVIVPSVPPAWLARLSIMIAPTRSSIRRWPVDPAPVSAVLPRRATEPKPTISEGTPTDSSTPPTAGTALAERIAPAADLKQAPLAGHAFQMGPSALSLAVPERSAPRARGRKRARLSDPACAATARGRPKPRSPRRRSQWCGVHDEQRTLNLAGASTLAPTHWRPRMKNLAIPTNTSDPTP
jgi:hypothetical protein